MAKRNESLQRKSSARQAAVQYFYQKKLTGAAPTPERFIAACKEDWPHGAFHDEGDLPGPEPDYALLEALLLGVEVARSKIDEAIAAVLSPQWPKERMSPVLIAILECGIWELRAGVLPAAVVIDEYVNLAAEFFDGPEAGFVNAALEKVAKAGTVG